ncbi:glycosyltransferase [Polaribacter sp. Asnod1-A03]|uniref:glycosyltransferase n=1 Tax=Polaribacter sp. Asnod1-A03 TaxID=3160581 RepID=UPI00386B3F09
MNTTQKKIIISPLNWGLGHATRCVPLINELLKNNFIPIIASDGIALSFLKKEFSALESLELPSYHISYGKNLKVKLLFQIPRVLKAIKKEHKIISDFVLKNKEIVGVISDNRFGVRSNLVHSVYVTHQINVLSGGTTFLTSYFHQKIIKKFDECWVPDNENSEFSGKLSSTKKKINLKYIGVLSRFKKEELTKNIDILVIISGPESNRTFLENKLISEFKNDKRKIIFVLGKVELEQREWTSENITFYNYLLSHQLQNFINSSEMIICRSGYSSIMDLAVLGKKVFLIPTENQPEQEYLSKYLEEKKIAPSSDIKNFTKENLCKLKDYKGLYSVETDLKSDLKSELISFLHGKRKL